MPRKSKQLKKEEVEAKKRLAEIEELGKLALEEELKVLQDTEKEILGLCEKAGLFCGLILDKDALLQLIQAYLDDEKNVIRVKFNVYYEEKE